MKTLLTPQLCKRIGTFALIWLAAGSIGIYSRLYPLRHFVSPDANDQATAKVVQDLQRSVHQAVAQKNPGLPAAERRILGKREFDRLLRERSASVREQIQKLAHRIDRDNPFAQKYPYLLASDSFYYYALTKNIEKTGRIGDQIRGSKFFYPLMLAPLGYWEPLNLHPYVGYLMHKTITVFYPGAHLMYSVSWTAPLLTLLALGLFLVIAAFLGCSGWSALAGSVIFLLTPIFLKRSCFGWYDDDIYSMIFPTLILAVLFYGFKDITAWRRVLFTGAAAVLAMSLYALFWHGWVFMESVVLISLLALAVYYGPVRRDNAAAKNLLKLFGLMSAGVLAGISVVFGPAEFFVLFSEGWDALKKFILPQTALWPELYITVGELRKATFAEMVDLTGGALILFLALTGIIASVIIAGRKNDQPRVMALAVLLIFLGFITVMAKEAQRFLLLCSLPVTIFALLGIDAIVKLLKNIFAKKFQRDQYRVFKENFTLGLLIAILISLPVYRAETKFPSLLNQIYNSTWDTALAKLNRATPADSVVNTWWPPGHFIKATAERRVTFDGATIDKPQAYWLANVYLATDEKVAVGLLRMLNGSGNQAVEYLQARGWKLSDAVDLLFKIVPLGREAAAKKLQSIIPDKQIQELLALTHKDPPPTYLMIYNDLMEKSLQLTFVGNWNFRKAETVNNNRQWQREIKRLSQQNYVKFLWEIAGGPPRQSDLLGFITASSSGIMFQEGLVISPDREARVNSKKFGQGTPLSVFYLEGNNVVEHPAARPTLPYSVILAKDGTHFTAMLLDRNLAQAMLTRLYFFNGKGLKYFEPFCDEEDFTRRTRIAVFKVKWEEFLKDTE